MTAESLTDQAHIAEVSRILAEFRQLIVQLETDASLKPLQRAHRLLDLWRRVDAAGLTAEAMLQPIRYEWLVWELKAPLPKPDQRRGHRFELSPGVSYPDIRSMDDREQFLAHVTDRVNQTLSPIHGARYADVLWEMRGGLGWAKRAGDSYLDSVPLVQSDKLEICRGDAIRRALLLGIQTKNTALITAGKLALLNELSLSRQRGFTPLAVQLLDFLLKVPPSHIETADLQLGRDFAAAAAAIHRTPDGERFIARGAFKALAVFEGRLGNSAAEWQAQLAIGETFEQEAAERVGDRAIEGLLLEDAFRHYHRIQARGRLDQLKVRIRAAYTAAQAQLHGVGEVIEFDAEPAIEFAARLASLPPEQSLAGYVSWAGRVPSVQAFRSRAQELLHDRPVLTVFPNALFADGRRVASAASEDEQRESWLFQLYRWHLEVQAAYRAVIVRHLADAGRWSADTVTDFLASGVAFDEDKLPLLRTGIERYLARDYTSALYVLVPQIEAILRRLLGKIGLPMTNIDQQGVTRELSLGKVLDTPRLKTGLGDDLSFYLEFLFVQQQGLNLRNDIAHGLFPANAAREPIAVLMLDVLLRLRALAITPDAEIAALGTGTQDSVRAVLSDAASGTGDEPSHQADTPGGHSATWIGIVIDRIVHEFHPMRVILFGSHARGEARIDSDIDLLVVLPNVGDRRQAAIEIRKAVADLPVAVDILVTDPEDIELRRDRRGDVLYAALREGRVVYDRE